MSTDTSPPGEPPSVQPPDAGRYLATQRSAEFAGLRRALRGFIFPMTVAFLAWYALYVILSAYARGFMTVQVVGNINVALLFGLLQFASTFLIAGVYARYASRRLDPVADRLRAAVEEGASR